MTPWLGVTAAWNYSGSRLFFTTNNLLWTLSDYDAFQVANPLAGYEGQMVTTNNLHADKRGDVDNLDTNTTSNRDIYTGCEFSFNARFPGGRQPVRRHRLPARRSTDATRPSTRTRSASATPPAETVRRRR